MQFIIKILYSVHLCIFVFLVGYLNAIIIEQADQAVALQALDLFFKEALPTEKSTEKKTITIYVARDDLSHKLIGMIKLQKIGTDTVKISHLYLDQYYRGKGLAIIFMQGLKTYFDEQPKITKIMLDVLKSNEHGVKLYTKLGASIIHKKKYAYSMLLPVSAARAALIGS